MVMVGFFWFPIKPPNKGVPTQNRTILNSEPCHRILQLGRHARVVHTVTDEEGFVWSRQGAAWLSCGSIQTKVQGTRCPQKTPTHTHNTAQRNTTQRNTTPCNTTQHHTTQHHTTNATQHHTTPRNTTQYHTTQHHTTNATQHHKTPRKTTHHNTTQHNTRRHHTTQRNTSQHNTTPQSTTPHNTTPHDTTQHNTTQHHATQHNTTQHRTTQPHAIQRQITPHHTTTPHNATPTEHNTTPHNTNTTQRNQCVCSIEGHVRFTRSPQARERAHIVPSANLQALWSMARTSKCQPCTGSLELEDDGSLEGGFLWSHVWRMIKNRMILLSYHGT